MQSGRNVQTSRSNLLLQSYILYMKAVGSSETSVNLYHTIQRHTEEDSLIRTQRRDEVIFCNG